MGGTFDTNSGKPIDNVLYGSSAFRYMLELVEAAGQRSGYSRNGDGIDKGLCASF